MHWGQPRGWHQTLKRGHKPNNQLKLLFSANMTQNSVNTLKNPNHCLLSLDQFFSVPPSAQDSSFKDRCPVLHENNNSVFTLLVCECFWEEYRLYSIHASATSCVKKIQWNFAVTPDTPRIRVSVCRGSLLGKDVLDRQCNLGSFAQLRVSEIMTLEHLRNTVPPSPTWTGLYPCICIAGHSQGAEVLSNRSSFTLSSCPLTNHNPIYINTVEIA